VQQQAEAATVGVPSVAAVGPAGVAAATPPATAGARVTSAGGGDAALPVVRCKGLPFSATVDSVMDFFDPLDIVEGGVHMKANAQGLPCGECYVVFSTEEDCIAAAKRNRQVMGHRYVNVERVTASEFAAAFPHLGPGGQPQAAETSAPPYTSAAANVPAPEPAPAPAPTVATAPAAAGKAGAGGGGGKNAVNGGQGASNGTEGGAGGAIVIKMRGLPYSATEQEITSFFSGLRISPGGVSIGRDASGRASGEAHVEFTTEGDVQAAMLLNRQRIGSRYIELFRTKQPPSSARRAVATTTTDGSNASDSLRLRGMPFNSTEADVLSFFKGYSLVAGGVKLGPQVGQGTVRFSSAEEARRAIVSLNHSYMGNRYIELFYN